MRKLLYVILLLLLVSACGPKKIPRDDMESILRDLLIQDQQIKQDRDLRKQADTSLVYEGIFHSYGYDTDDFIHSLAEYLEDPARMEKIMGEVADDLEKQTKQIGRKIRDKEWREGYMRIYSMKPDTSKGPKPRIRPADTLRIRFNGDSVWMYYPPDTLVIPMR